MTGKKPRLAILHYSCPPVIGGVEFVIEDHARLFAEAGFKTKLIVGTGGSVHPDVRTVRIPEIASDGGPIRSVVRSLGRGKVPREFDVAVARVEKKLGAALRDVDVCMMHNVLTMHFNLVLTAALANIMASGRDRVFVGWTHDSTFGDPNYRSHQRDDYPWSLLSRKLSGCRYVAISAQRQKEVSRLFGVRASDFVVIPDGIDVRGVLGLTPLVARLFREEDFPGVDIVALTPTRIVRRKNLEGGMEIVAALKKLGKSVRWMITGAPDPHNADAMDYFRKLTALRSRLKIRKEVIFLSQRLHCRVSDEDLRALLAVCNMLIFPSLREGFGIPVLEGGLAGLVMVLSDIPAFREIAGRDAVYLRKGESPEKTARRAIEALARSPRLVFRKKTVRAYCWKSVFAKKILPMVTAPDSFWKKRG